ncbi:uncharacterized protein Tco_0705708 [Tanacetum coccineum]|uniref:Helitron helicase-like domain-containing protein n=1 Tax=Tanacetum coccineum TaxID=301880 RepID=A0ABQ4Y7G1_9ASTR
MENASNQDEGRPFDNVVSNRKCRLIMFLTPFNRGTNASVNPAILKKQEYQKSYYQRCKQKKLAEANANVEPHTPVGGTSASVDPTILKTRECQRRYYQRCKQKKIAESNADMESTTPVGATQDLSALTRETTLDDQHGSHVLLPLFDQEYNQTIDMDGTNASVDPTILKRRECQRRYYQRCKHKKIAEANADMESPTPVGATQDLSALTRETTLDDQHGSNVLLPLFDQEYNQTMDMDEIVTILSRVLAPNPYVHTFRSLGNLGPLDKYRVELTVLVKVDQRLYNRPTTSEVADIWVEGNENITTYKISIVVYGRSEYPTHIQPYFACYDPLSYPLFFPNGEAGWHPRIPKEGVDIRELFDDEDDVPEDEECINTTTGRKTVTMREYYCYKFQIRPYHSLILFGGRLFQQFVVDTYIKIETSCLQFCEINQSTIREDLYQGIVDCVNAGDVQSNRFVQIIVLAVSFIGGPRAMRRRFLDAMTLVQDAGKPDIFLTMTCNPNWPEIVENLYEGQTAQD